MSNYDHTKVEKKWQKQWEKDKIYKTPDSVKGRDNSYLLVEFPYPSGNLHVGHWYAFAVPDILARAMRMQGKNVLYPIGFDAFGLPAENAAIKNKINPRTWTLKNIEYMKNQIRSMGTSFDWSREVVTCDPAYYKWTQWLFLQFFKAGLAYRKNTAVNWCPKDKTVLANEQVVAGKCERCDSDVVQKKMLQWNIKITDYADRLIDDLKDLNWPEQIKESQRNWIGRSEGAEIDFLIETGEKYKFVIFHGFEGSPDLPRWQWVKKELEAMGHEVLVPRLPNSGNPSEAEQVEFALRTTKYDERTVLVGHSLGAVLALKVAERLTKPLARLVTVGGFVDTNFKDKKRSFEKKWTWKFDGEAIRKNVRSVTVLHDPRDHAISDAQTEALAKLLGTQSITSTSNKPHFTGDTEPDVLMWLRPTVRVFTTRADTLFGATYLVLAPEHPWVIRAVDGKHNILKNKDEIKEYVEKAKRKTDLERQADQKEKSGVELNGVKAINPASGKKIPVWVADYVLGHYGTGAIMAVPAHDERDHAFATKFNLPINEVIEPLVVQTRGLDAVHADEEFFARRSILAVVKHWSEEKYQAVLYKPTDVRGFVSGGIHDGEDPVSAAKREIAEETGYSNAVFVRQLGGAIHSKYFSDVRKRNTSVYYTPLLFKLENGLQNEISPEEKAEHEVSWLSKDEMDNFINREDMRIAWCRVIGNACYAKEGILVDSGEFSGLASEAAALKIVEKFGRKKTTYKLRDWIVSRQRYWGVPIPIIHCPTCGPVAVEDRKLPVKLPEVKDYLPEGSGKSPLAKVTKWVKVRCPQCKGGAERETDTFDTFVDSSWYFQRYTDPNNKKQFADPKKLAKWMPIDLYSGGAEHTTMHVLYSRFWQKAMYDLGLVKDKEPYTRRMNRSLIMGPDGQKMSKSRGNVIDPDEVVALLGSDTVRMYLAFIGPYNEVSNYPWNPDGVVGVRRFIERVWRMRSAVEKNDIPGLNGLLHKTIKKVGEDIGALKFNTGISQLMIFLNAIEKEGKIGRLQWGIFLRLIAPFAPHMAEELWRVDHKKSIHLEKWPRYDETLLKSEILTIAVQINGKTRGTVEVDIGADRTVLEDAARKIVKARLDGKNVLRTIVVPGRLVNFVVQD